MRQPRLTAELLALVDRVETDPGPDAHRVPMTDDDYAAAAADILTKCGGGPLRIFAYGSLLWKPGFDYFSRAPARVFGWHRAFCMTLTRFRGSPENPGLMLALDHGGSCVGEVFEVQPDAVAIELGKLLRREIPYRRLARPYRWVEARTARGPVPALTFYAGMRKDHFYAVHPIAEQARLIARAAGHGGSAAAYLFQTVNKLEELGIHDSYIWQLEEQVAAEIRRMHPLA